jgi:large subunit ribosomal protein L4
VHLLAVDQLNTYDVLLSDDVIFTQGAYDAFVNGTAAASSRRATIVEPPAHDAVEDGDETVVAADATEAVETEPAATEAVETEPAETESGEDAK